MREIGIGIVGGGYMGKAHAVAMRAVGAVFDTALRPRLEMVCATSEARAARYRDAYGFARSTADWRALVADPAVEAVVVASPQDTHLAIAGAALAAGKPVLCEKPLGVSAAESGALVAAAERAGVATMVGFNYIRTPASRFARQLIAEGALGRITWFRGEHAEDYLADPASGGGWKTRTRATGAIFDIGSHILNAARALAGPIVAVSAAVETVHRERPGPGGGREPVLNDDQGQIMCRFAGGAMGHVFYSRVQTGRKMGYAYEIVGTDGAIRFDQEDQNSIWLYRAEGREAERGFRRILAGPAHPDFEPFCQGPGHGTGYQDQIVIEARDFLRAIDTGAPVWPTFREGHAVNCVIEAALASATAGGWVEVAGACAPA